MKIPKIAMTASASLLATLITAGSTFAQLTPRDLGTLGGANSIAQRINDLGQVGGSSETIAGPPHGFLWQAGSMTDLGTLGGSMSDAQDIDNRGQVVGFS